MSSSAVHQSAVGESPQLLLAAPAVLSHQRIMPVRGLPCSPRASQNDASAGSRTQRRTGDLIRAVPRHTKVMAPWAIAEPGLSSLWRPASARRLPGVRPLREAAEHAGGEASREERAPTRFVEPL